jgi:hypothetical protein
MKPTMLPPFYQIFDYIRPKTICEIGTHDGKSAIQFVDYCLQINPKLKYYGYDAFDAVKNNQDFHEKEINGKGAGSMYTATKNLEHRQKKYKNFEFKLIKGFTNDTLKESVYDFVYIDGGHSYETVKHDYNMVSKSKVIVFDDYQTPGVKKFFDELVLEIKIPKADWESVWSQKKPCRAFLPHISKHIQPVIFNG